MCPGAFRCVNTMAVGQDISSGLSKQIVVINQSGKLFFLIIDNWKTFKTVAKSELPLKLIYISASKRCRTYVVGVNPQP